MQRTAIQKERKFIPRVSPGKLEAYKAAHGGKLPFSTIAPKNRFIAPRKKRTSTPILSTPYPGALDPRSHYTADRRLKLYGKDKSAQREKIFERAWGRCQERTPEVVWVIGGIDVHMSDRCPNKATEWSHNRHGSNKCDCLKCGIASCADCHRRKHNSGKTESVRSL